MKLYISPHPNTYVEDGTGSGGIWRVIKAQEKHLPQYGVEIVDSPEEADVVNIHAGALIDTRKPIVQSGHGYYWTGDFVWRDQYWHYNNLVIETSRRASRIIVPSQWVAYPIRRDMRMIPYVIPHGVDIELFEPAQRSDNFVLWAKPRIDIVSDPAPLNRLADVAKAFKFKSTHGRPSFNVDITGVMPHHEFLEMMRNAAIWLATTRETGDIASREAMAMAIPVCGWDYGGTAELVIHGETGYLAKHGDYNDLASGLLYCMENRGRLGRAGRELIQQKYQWKDIMGQYAAVFYDTPKEYPVKVSVVVPTYNYAQYLPDCLHSIANQGMRDFEIVVVDDGSTDSTPEVLGNLIKELNLNIRIVRKENGGLCSALNAGHAAAEGKYILNLDVDNMLPPQALEILSDAMDERPWLDVVSGGLIHQSDEKVWKAQDWPFGRIDIHQQLHHINQLTSSSMMRAASIERFGGYRERMLRNEDGEWWCRLVSGGLRFEQVTQEPTLIYRWHDGRKSQTEGGEHNIDGPLSWNFYFPHKENVDITPFAMTGNPPKGSWAVRSYANAHVAVCIPCGPDHERYLMDALDSIAGQTYQNIECIVCNDTGKPLDVAAMGHPWVRVIDGPRKGPGAARNTAIAAANAPLIVPLDADDMLYPNAIRQMYLAWLDWPHGLVYMDCEIEDSPDNRKYYHSGNWTWGKIRREAIYQVTTLYPKQWWKAVGGYPVPGAGLDMDLGFEDWLFGIKLHLMGIDAIYIQEPWGVYRHWTGIGQSGRDNEGFGTPEFKEKIKRYYDWIAAKEEEIMGCCPPKQRAGGRVTNQNPPGAPQIEYEGQLHAVYRGPRGGGFGVNSRVMRGRKYRVTKDVPFPVEEGDEWILRLVGFEQYAEGPQLMSSLPASLPEAPILEEMPLGAPKLYPDEPVLPPVSIGPMPLPVGPTAPLQQPVDNGRMLSLLPGVDIGELSSLTQAMVESLRSVGIHKVSDLAYDIEENAALRVLSARGVGPVRFEKLQEEIFE